MTKRGIEKTNYKIPVIILIVFIAVAWVGTILIVPKIYGDKAGTFGDMFGGLNALFSGLAFVGVIIAILLQKNELELQREELENTREEIKGQKLQLEEQNKTLKKQNFEGTFFQLIKLYNDIVNSIDFDDNPALFFPSGKERQRKPLIIGRDVFVKLYFRLERSVLDMAENEIEKNKNIDLSHIIEKAYEQFYEEHQSDLGHYFRAIYNLIKFVDKSEIVNKKFYTDILRAQLSSHELLILHYNCQSIYGKEKMLPYLKDYNLLKHLPKKELLETKILATIDRLKLRSEKNNNQNDSDRVRS